ncbi:MAG: recombinase family protein, partial [Acidobacteria bacterium]|nr:recombinase family protein [Acidobacteriota bacterium]
MCRGQARGHREPYCWFTSGIVAEPAPNEESPLNISGVERRIVEAEAAVVRRIFDLCAGGIGYSRIAKQLNAEGAVSP